MKAKHQRLILVIIAFVALLAAVLIAAWAARNNASYFYTPSDIAEKGLEVDQAVRLGGMVKQGSIMRGEDGVTVNFVVMDEGHQLPVTYRGITPDLFVEGSGVVAEGHLSKDGVFVANHLLAKHDENYVPREMKDMKMAKDKMTQAEQPAGRASSGAPIS